MSAPDGAPPSGPPRYSGGQIAMIVIGMILLLPGLCALVFMIGMIPDMRGSDPIVQMIVSLWVICFAVSAGGIALMYAARRNARRAANRLGSDGAPKP